MRGFTILSEDAWDMTPMQIIWRHNAMKYATHQARWIRKMPDEEQFHSDGMLNKPHHCDEQHISTRSTYVQDTYRR